MAKSIGFTSMLFKFAFFPDYERHIAYLAETLADKEESWDFSDTIKKNMLY